MEVAETNVSNETKPAAINEAKKVIISPKNGFININCFHDKATFIERMVLDTYQSVVANAETRHQKYKELSGFVLWNKSQPYDSFVISLATGTKCSSGESLRFDGIDIIDMHAEVLARRSLVHFLYTSLLERMGGTLNFLVKSKSQRDHIFYIHDNFEIHLYISSAPCGDARVFLNNTNINSKKDAHPNRKCRGLLRTKLESGAGTVPVSDLVHQSIDGIKDGKGLKIMSCSDKLLKWNILGLQGTFLSTFMKPAYIKSVVVGALFNIDHIERALYGRASNIALHRPFYLNKPILIGLGNKVAEGNASNYSFVYNSNFGSEIIGSDGTLVATDEKSYSKICRRSLFELYIQLQMASGFLEPSEKNLYQYHYEKNIVINYNRAKHQFYCNLYANRLKVWLNKPTDINMFYVRMSNSSPITNNVEV